MSVRLSVRLSVWRKMRHRCGFETVPAEATAGLASIRVVGVLWVCCGCVAGGSPNPTD